MAECADMGSKAVSKLLMSCKGGSTLAESDSDRDRSEFRSSNLELSPIHHLVLPRILGAGRDSAEAFKRLLKLVHSTVKSPIPENKMKLGPFSKAVADSVKVLVDTVEDIKGALSMMCDL